MKDAGKYDLVVKDLFQRDHPSLLDQLTAGVPVREVLNVELARVEERRADLVLLLADGTILHLEFQSTNDRNMPYREGIYCLLLGQKYRRRVRQVVLYLGQAKMRMENQVDLGETRAAYTLMDIRQLDSEQLLASGKPGDWLWRCWRTAVRSEFRRSSEGWGPSAPLTGGGFCCKWHYCRACGA